MPLVLNDSVRDLSRWAFGSPVLNSILGSSIFVALIISFIMVLLIMIMYPAKAGTPFSVIAKMFVYMLFSSMLVIFLHDSILKHMYEEEEHEDREDSIILGSTTPDVVYGATYRPINPNSSLQQQRLLQQNTPQQNTPQQNTNLIQQIPARQEIISVAEGGPITGGSVLDGVKIKRKVDNPYL
jgi:hypothetical protein